jgi:hypothetical protein
MFKTPVPVLQKTLRHCYDTKEVKAIYSEHQT